MKNIIKAFRSLLRSGRNNGIKILSLGVGLAVGLVLISKVLFEQTYDDFFPDNERIYGVTMGVHRDGEEPGEFPQTSGAIAPGMKREIPEVEDATRYIHFGKQVFRTMDKLTHEGSFVMADTSFFDVLPLPVVAGSWKDILSRPMYVMASARMARKLGGVENAIGKTFELDMYPERVFTIGGVFKDIPENSHITYDMIISMASISSITYDGTENWNGNDRYRSYVKLYPGVDPESLAPAIRAMQERHQPLERLEKNGLKLWYGLIPLTKVHSDSPEVKRMSVLLSLLALALICTAVLNYILIVLSSLVSRTKEMAVYKSYGASGRNILSIMMSETAVHLCISLLVAIILIVSFQWKIDELLNVSLGALFNGHSLILLFFICLFVFLIAGFIPSLLYARIPVAATFRSFKESRRNWKLASLLLQFIACTFLVSLLIIIWKQYHLMVNDDPGYNYENLLYVDTQGVEPEQRQRVLNELSSLPVVKGVATASVLPFYGASGNNVFLPDVEYKELFNIGDMYTIDENYFDLMEIRLLEGVRFDPTISGTYQIFINERFVEKMVLTAGWDERMVGRDIYITEHQDKISRISGVFPDIRIGSIADEDGRPNAFFFAKSDENTLLMIKLHELKYESLQLVNETLVRLLPDKYINLQVYKEEMRALYDDSRKFRDAVIIGGIVTLLISLIGLIGYLKDEIARRQAEIAIRKINGATIKDILTLFIADVIRIAVPSLLLGGIAAYITAMKWQENFSVKTDLSFLIFVGSAIAVLILIISVVCVSCYRTAMENPVNSLKSE